MERLFFNSSETIRIDLFLRRELPLKTGENPEIFSNSKIRRLIVSGQVFVNGKKVQRPAFELRGKSAVSVEFDREKFVFEKQPDDIKFDVTDQSVLFEDDNLIFINKPSGFPVEQTITGNRDNLHDSLVNYLWKRNPQLKNPPYAGIMHRLDKDTSGVILFTKNRPVNKPVSALFQSHNFIKEYYAVAEDKKGKLFAGKKFSVEKYMGRISGKSQAGIWGTVPESKGGQFSRTDFEVIKPFEPEKDGFKSGNSRFFLIKCTLFTGRTHQIRVHLSEEGFPIAGDVLYGGVSAERLYLHAFRLAAVTDELKFDVTAPLPF